MSRDLVWPKTLGEKAKTAEPCVWCGIPTRQRFHPLARPDLRLVPTHQGCHRRERLVVMWERQGYPLITDDDRRGVTAVRMLPGMVFEP